MDDVSEPDPRLDAVAWDVLCIEIEGPSRPHLTVVDIPGLIANATKDITGADVKILVDIMVRFSRSREPPA